MSLTATLVEKINHEMNKFPTDQKQSVVMAALRIVQNERGYLSPDSIAEVAAHLDMPIIAVHEVATFYNMYHLKKVGLHTLTICTNLPCALSGGVDAANYIKTKLGLEFNQTSPDGRFTLKEGECLGACGDAPVMLHNNHKMCSFMSHEKIDSMISELSKEGSTV